MKLEIEQTIRVICSLSTSKSAKETDDIVSVSSKEMKEAEGNSIQAESTTEMVNEDDTGLASCLINLDFDKGPTNVPRKREPVVLDDSEREESSQALDSDEDNLRSDKQKMNIDRRPTKQVKSGIPTTGRAYNTPPQLLQAPSASQSHFSCQDLVKALSTMKTMFAKLSYRNVEYLHFHNKSTVLEIEYPGI